MKDSFCEPYVNPRTGNRTYGGAARNGRLKTLGGVDSIIKKTIKMFHNAADSDNNRKAK
ncbi:hypothetical protein RCC09_004597 [Vibrio parahaemolyticus]|nr:hypothetical protein [Vibrio parahaemolyticus]ELA7299485.1 hypothetical protein [Vibrio parahaemolyticus]